MLPPYVRTETKSNAERRTFGRISRELDDRWSAVHSLGLAGHARKPWAEIDFVLIGPPGVFCLEVKGGRVSRTAGVWQFTDKNGRVSEKHEGPFDQVGSASSALRQHLVRTHPQLRGCIVGYGVVTPDIRFDIVGPDIEPELVYDAGDIEDGFGKYVDRLIAHWQSRVARSSGLSPSHVQMVVDLLRGDFDLRPSLRTRVGIAKDELLQLTDRQYAVLDGLVDNPRALIRGGAGTGKTLLAVEEAHRVASKNKSVMLCCYSRPLSRYLRRAVSEAPSVTATNLHSFMHSVVEEAGALDRLPPAEPSDLFLKFYPDLCLEILINSGRMGMFDVLIVDEVQDLLADPYIDVFDALLEGGLKEGRWRFFFDPNQDVFEGIQVRGMDRLLNARPTQFRLQSNCRNTQPIAVNTAILSALPQMEACEALGPDVDYYWYRDAADGARQLTRHLNRILSDGIAPLDIVILSKYRRDHSPMMNHISRLPYPIEEYAADDPRPAGLAIRFSTISGFKGLESDVVVLIDVEELSSDSARSQLYVGTSRPNALLAIFLSHGAREDYEQLAFEFGQRTLSAKGSV